MNVFQRDHAIKMWKMILTGDATGSVEDATDLYKFLKQHNLSDDDLWCLERAILEINTLREKGRRAFNDLCY